MLYEICGQGRARVRLVDGGAIENFGMSRGNEGEDRTVIWWSGHGEHKGQESLYLLCLFPFSVVI
jgi:hypothetical protein